MLTPPRLFSALAYLCVCLNAVALKYYELTDTPAFSGLTAEDSSIENLTAVLLFSAGTLLLVTGRMERKSLRRWIYVVGGSVLLFVAGEEISWGQRIFGYSTPDWIAESNTQKEFSLHNLDVLEESFRKGFEYGVQLLCMMACVSFFAGRERIRGIPVPSILLTLSLLAIHSYHNDRLLNISFTSTFDVLTEAHNTLICLIIIFALFRRQYELLIFSASALLLSLALTVVNLLKIPLPPAESHHPHEVFEYLIALSISCYSLDLFLNQRPFIQTDHSVRRSTLDQGRESIDPFVRRFVHLIGRRFLRVLDTLRQGIPRPLWLTIPTLSISTSVGLTFSAYVDYRTVQTYVRNLAEEVASREPIIRSHFNVWLSQNRIIYWKKPCHHSDVQSPFFLYVIPTDLNEFPISRRFSFFEDGGILYRRRRGGHSCFLVQPLLRGGIAHIRTGQESRWKGFTPVYRQAHDVDGQADRFERSADRAITNAYRRMYDAVVSREPRVRSDYDIYLHDNSLFFVKEPCLRSDVEAVFFLHVEPVDNASLPFHRQRFRFDNLDFRFSDFGVVFDDKCIAFVSLPAYDISRIVTGRYTSEKRLWQAEIPFQRAEDPVSPGA